MSSSMRVIQGLSLCTLCMASASVAPNVERRLAEEKFVNLYEPSMNVDTYALIDKDIQAVSTSTMLGTTNGIEEAANIYKKGGYSQSYAELQVSALEKDIAGGALVKGTTTAGGQTQGYVMEAAKAGDTILKVQYDADRNCFVGGLKDPVRDHCFAHSFDSGNKSVQIDNKDSIDYVYNALSNTKNGQTLELITNKESSGSKIHDMCFEYSGTRDYEKKMITAAFNGGSTNFPKADTDFHLGKFDAMGRSAFLRWAFVVVNVWSHVVELMEEAAAVACNGGDGLPVWDQAVAFYTGSISKSSGADGYLLFSLADTECFKFGTCANGLGMAEVNKNVLDFFKKGKELLSQKKCNEAKDAVTKIQSQMTVPLIQGLYRRAYILKNMDNTNEDDEGEAAAFAASILPLANNCQADVATVIHKNLAPGEGKQVSFEVLKSNLEKTYDCLGITCDDVGGLINTDSSSTKYVKNAEPCDYKPSGGNPPANPPTTSTTNTNVSPPDLGSPDDRPLPLIFIVAAFVVVVGCLACMCCRRRQASKNLEPDLADLELSDTPSNEEIEAPVEAGEFT